MVNPRAETIAEKLEAGFDPADYLVQCMSPVMAQAV